MMRTWRSALHECTWDRFVETFFNAKVMLKYLPDILSGMVVTIELAVLIVHQRPFRRAGAGVAAGARRSGRSTG